MNMEIWDKVCKTDPKHTKKVEFGRKFTAIDAHYQIMRATEVFGPVGKGWGYNCEHGFHENFAWCDVTLWWADDDTEMHQYGPFRGMSETISAKGKVDTDAPKKAMTDALTKALSHLGFSADVFMGLYDDNKYIAQITQEFDQIGKTPVDTAKIQAIADLCAEVVDEDDEENGPAKAKELYAPLSNDERMALQSILKAVNNPVDKSGNPIRKTYWSCFHDHLKAAAERDKK